MTIPELSCHLAASDYGLPVVIELQVPRRQHFLLSPNLPLGQGMFFRDTLVSLGVLVTTITVRLVLSRVLAFYRVKQNF